MAVTPPSDTSDKRARAKLAMDNADQFFGSDDDEVLEPSRSGDGLPFSRWALIRYCVPHGFWLGLLVGSVDSIYLAAGLKVPVDVLSFLGLGLISVMCFGLMGLIFGLLLGLPLHLVLKHSRPSRFATLHFSTVGFCLFGAFFGCYAFNVWAADRMVPALVLSSLPFLLWGVLWMNAAPRFRRVEMGRSSGLSWWLVALSITLLVLSGSTGAYLIRKTSSSDVLDTDPNVVLITVDGLRADFETFELPAEMRELVAGSALFEQVLAPHPGTLSAHASILTGLHPTHHEVLSASDRLKGSIETLPRVMKREGFSSAAFVSSTALDAEFGLSTGFYTYDDSLGWPLPGFGSLWIAQLPIWSGRQVQRTDTSVTRRFDTWISGHDGSSFLAWIHMVGATGAAVDSRSEYQGWLDDWSPSVLSIVDRLRSTDEWDNTMLVIVGSTGHLLGEKKGFSGHQGLFDEVVHVPLMIRYPGGEHAGRRVVDQVRTYDVYATILERLELVAITKHEGTPLGGYLRDEMKGSMWCVLFGDGSEEAVSMVGLRHQGFKYMVDLNTEDEWLFDLSEDPSESINLVSSQADLLKQVRTIVETDRSKLLAH